MKPNRPLNPMETCSLHRASSGRSRRLPAWVHYGVSMTTPRKDAAGRTIGAHRAPRARGRWDVAVTAVLWLPLIGIAAVIYYFGFFFAFGLGGCAEKSCDVPTLNTVGYIALYAPAIIAVAAIVVSIFFVRAGRRAFYVPLLGIVLILIVWSIAFGVMSAAIT